MAAKKKSSPKKQPALKIAELSIDGQHALQPVIAQPQPEVLLALEAGIKKALPIANGELKDSLEGGQTFRNMEIVVKLSVGEMVLGHDTTRIPTASIPLLASLALVLKRSGFQREQSMEILRQAMKDALTLDQKAADTLMEELGVKEAETQLKEEVIKNLPKTQVKKSITIKNSSLQIISAFFSVEGGQK